MPAKYIRTTTPAIMIMAIMAMTGCSATPSSDDGRKVIEQGYGEFANVVEFKKIDGQSKSVFGVKGYQMAFEAKVQITKTENEINDMFHSPIVDQDQFIQKVKNFSSLIGFEMSTSGVFPVKGTIYPINGSIQFSKSEGGWHGTME